MENITKLRHTIMFRIQEDNETMGLMEIFTIEMGVLTQLGLGSTLEMGVAALIKVLVTMLTPLGFNPLPYQICSLGSLYFSPGFHS